MALSENKAPVTGNPDDTARDRAKYGLPRDGSEGAAAAEASRVNNEFPVALELAEGRCPVDGLPAGNCAHFPGPQHVVAEDGETVYEEGYGPQDKTARERLAGERSRDEHEQGDKGPARR